MEGFVIAIQDGLPVGAPYSANNFIEHHPEIDINNLPADQWCVFVPYSGDDPVAKLYHEIQFEYYIEDGICKSRPIYVQWDADRIAAAKQAGIVAVTDSINKRKEDALHLISLYPAGTLPHWEKYVVALENLVVEDPDEVVFPRVPLTPARERVLIEQDPNYDPTPSPEVAEKLRLLDN